MLFRLRKLVTRYLHLLLCMIGGVALVGCVRPPEFPYTGELQAEYRGLFILNEGQWNVSNATLDYYDPQRDYARTAEVFFRTNGLRLGDVANDAVRVDDTLYIVMNNSQLLYKLQLPTLQLLAQLQLPALASPRTFVQVAPDKAYVNSLLGGTLYVLDPRTLTLRYSLSLDDHAEGMLWLEDRVFVTIGSYPGRTNNRLAVIDPLTDAISYLTLPVENPGPMAVLPDGRLAIGCRGNYVNTNSAICLLNPATLAFTDTVYVDGYLYDLAAMPGRLLFTSDFAISSVRLADNVIEYNWIDRSRLGARDTDLLYSLHWDAIGERIYITNAGFGAQNGRCHILDAQRNLLRTLETGVFPGTVFWVR